MGSINRATLPQAFLDSVNAAMMLPTPEPQYWFANAALGGRVRAEALRNSAFSGLGYVQSIMGAGGVPDALDRMVRAADSYPGAVLNLDDKFGEGKGTVYKLLRRKFSGGGFTEADRLVTVDKSTSTTGRAIQMEDVEVVLQQYEGPWDSSASAVAPIALYDFDKRYGASRVDLVGEAFTHLMQDATKWLDTVIRDRFRAAHSTTFSDTSITAATGFSAAGGLGANLEMIKRARKTLSDREWMSFPNGRYVLLVPTEFDLQMLGDTTYRELSKSHAAGVNQLYGYIGSIHNVDIFEVTTLKTYVATDSVPNTPGNSDGGTVASGVTLYEALLIGPGAVAFGSPANFESFYADDTDYGKAAKVIWRLPAGLQTVDSRGIQRILFQNV